MDGHWPRSMIAIHMFYLSIGFVFNFLSKKHHYLKFKLVNIFKNLLINPERNSFKSFLTLKSQYYK